MWGGWGVGGEKGGGGGGVIKKEIRSVFSCKRVKATLNSNNYYFLAYKQVLNYKR